MRTVLKLAHAAGLRLLNATTRQRIGPAMFRRAPVYCVLALLGAGVLLPPAYSQNAAFSEEEIKAAFLYHFGSYVQWPTTSTDPVTIGVLGADGVAAQLDVFLQNRTIQNRPVEARRLTAVDDLDDVEILFIGREHNDALEPLLAAVRERPVLSVTDAERGLDSGAIVNFQIVENRVRFEISVPAAERAGLMLSSRLLSAAMRVRTSWCGPGCRKDGLSRALAVLVRALLGREEAAT